jgi:hypothetical protein
MRANGERLLACFMQVGVTVILVVVQRTTGSDDGDQYWVFFWIFFVQVINIVVFMYWFYRLLQKSDEKSVWSMPDMRTVF